MAGLLHQESAALLPVPLQELLQGLWLAGGVQHACHSMRLSLKPTGRCLGGPPSTRQRNARQLGHKVWGVGRLVVGNLGLREGRFS